MPKTIHIHIHKKTTDAGTFKEDQHKRDKGGQFTAGGGNAVHHETQAGHYEAQSRKHPAGSTEQVRNKGLANTHSSIAQSLSKADSYGNRGDQGQSPEVAKKHRELEVKEHMGAANLAAKGLPSPTKAAQHKDNIKLDNGGSLSHLGGGKYNVYPKPTKPGERVKPVLTAVTLAEVAAKPHVGRVLPDTPTKHAEPKEGTPAYHEAQAKAHLSKSEHTSTTTAKPGSPDEARVLAAYHHSNAAHHAKQAEGYKAGGYRHTEQTNLALSQHRLAKVQEAKLAAQPKGNPNDTPASIKANNETRRANTIHDVESHTRASQAHQEAVQFHTKAGNAAAATAHAGFAAGHEQEANRLKTK
jgi:hypothetical protein